MNDKNFKRHMAYEALVILGLLALLTYITRLWPILLLIILGIFIATLRLLFLSCKKVEPVKPTLALPPPSQPPVESDMQSMAYAIIQRRITQILRDRFPEVDGFGRIRRQRMTFWQEILSMFFLIAPVVTAGDGLCYRI